MSEILLQKPAPSLPRSPRGRCPLPAPAQHSPCKAPALLTHWERQTGAAGAVGHASHLPHGFGCSHGDNAQGSAGDTPVAGPDLGTSALGSSPMDDLGLRCPGHTADAGELGAAAPSSPHLPSRSWGPLAVVGSAMQNVV